MEYHRKNPVTQTELIVDVYAVINEVADVIATFDGKFTFRPFAPDGQGMLHFKTRRNLFHLQLEPSFHDQGNVSIALSWWTTDENKRLYRTVYEGAYDKNTCRQRLSAALAAWYGQAVRNELPVGENSL